MSLKKPRDAQRIGWNPAPSPSLMGTYRDGLEAILFNGDNFPDVREFLHGDVYLLSAGVLLVDASDRAFFVRTGDIIVRYANGSLGRHRPSDHSEAEGRD